MKRLLLFTLVTVMLVSICSVSFAKPTISKQPQNVEVKAGGTANIKLKASGFKGLTWFFVDPVSGEKISAKEIKGRFPKLRVTNPNGQSLILKRVPEEMHRWSVYAHLSADGYHVDSDSVQIIIKGMDEKLAAENAAAEAAAAEAEAAAAQAPTEEAATAAEPVIETVEIPVDPITGDPIIVEDISSGAITITADGFDLYTLSRGGKPTGEPQKTLTFEGSADFCVMADGIIQYITFNGIQLAPQGDVTGMIFRNVTVDAEISGRDSKAALEASGRTVETVPASSEETKTEPESEPVTEPVEVETQQSETEAPAAADNASAGMVTITCEYCRFTGGGLSFVTSGSVPVGTVIMVASGSEGNIHNGYRINGGDPVNLDKASFRLTVTEDTTITMEKR